MATAWTPLANITLGSAQTTVTFSSISQAYRDLVVVVSPIAATTGNAGRFRFNSDSGSNYSWVLMYGDGSSAASNNSASTTEFIGLLSETTVSNTIIHVMDYSTTNKHKTVMTRTSGTANYTGATAQKWASTSAVTSISLYMTGGTNYAAGSTFALYGVSA